MHKLTARRFDALVQPQLNNNKIIWTAGAIAQRIGTSADYVRHTLINLPDTPVRKIGGRYCAHSIELDNFFKVKHTQT